MAESTRLYRAIMSQLEARRVELGLPMWRVDDLSGAADNYFSKAIYPDTASGRRAGWSVLDEFVTALFGPDFQVQINGQAKLPTSLGTAEKVDERYRNQRHWRHTKFYRTQGARGGAATVAKHGVEHMAKIGRKANRIRWSKVRKRAKQITDTLDKATGK